MRQFTPPCARFVPPPAWQSKPDGAADDEAGTIHHIDDDTRGVRPAFLYLGGLLAGVILLIAVLGARRLGDRIRRRLVVIGR